jgi:hypothetical protein
MRDKRKKLNKVEEEIEVFVWRVASCQRSTHGPGPAIYRSPDGLRSEYGDLVTCGSVWHCPICARKITSGRRDGLMAALAAWIERGGAVYLLTYTHSHGKNERPIAEHVEAQARALSKFKGSRAFRAILGEAGSVGAVRALEVTHGEINGWHPHTHELLFALPGQARALGRLRKLWVRRLIASELAGLTGNETRTERFGQLRYLLRHALTVQDGAYAAEYVAKYGHEPATDAGGAWGPASEVTKGHIKTGKRLTGRTPFELLRLYSEEGDKRAGMLFRDYALAFHGRRQLYWSPQLRESLAELCAAQAEQIYFRFGAVAEWRTWRARLAVLQGERTDEEIAAARSQACSEFVVRLDPADWRMVLRTNTRFDVLMAARLGGAAEVRELLDRLRSWPATHGEEFKQHWPVLDRLRRAA